MNRVVIITASASLFAACSLLAPSDNDLFGVAPPTGGLGGLAGLGGANGHDGGSGGASAGDDGGGGSAGASGEGNPAGAGGALAEGGASGGGAASGGEAGSGGAEPVCAAVCGPNEVCKATVAGAECACVDGFVRDGAACRLPRSCNELNRAAPDLPSRAYDLQPVGATSSFRSHCGMALEGAGWTLVVNEGPTFDPATMGVADVCYSSTCTNAGYSQVVLESDVMIDISNSPIANSTYTARVVVNGVHPMSRGKTLRTLFTTGPNYVDAEDNSNVIVRMMGGAECTTLPLDMAKVVCDECAVAGCAVPVMVFGDADSAAGCRAGAAPRFAVGAANAYATPWTNCAGWPQDPNSNGADFYPDYVRVWIR